MEIIIYSYIKNGYYPVDKTVIDYLLKKGYTYKIFNSLKWNSKQSTKHSVISILPQIEKYFLTHDYILLGEDDLLIHLTPGEIEEIIKLYPDDIVLIGYQKIIKIKNHFLTLVLNKMLLLQEIQKHFPIV